MSDIKFPQPGDSYQVSWITSPGSTMSSEFEPPKKKRTRARLDHMTTDQKLERRKEKNRIAAQTARDRKRAKIDYLEDENRKLRMENEFLKSQLRSGAGLHLSSVPMIHVTDSGISEADSFSKESGPASVVDDSESHESHSNILRLATRQYPNSPATSSTSEADLNSPLASVDNVDLIDSVVQETDDKTIINEILQFSESIREESGDFVSIESAELINAPQQQVQETRSPSSWVENSAGWTSVQLMLLLMISRVHRHFSTKINCCAKTLDKSGGTFDRYNNLYDYVHQTQCRDYRNAVSIIISHKCNVQLQRVAALKFMYKCLYSYRPPMFAGPSNCSKQIQNNKTLKR